MFGKKEEKVEEVKKPDEDWMTKKWRPMMAMMYMTCCLMDFAIFPIMFTIVQFWETAIANDAFRQWVPITLQGGGLFHVAMGGVLGVTAYGRTQEKVAGAANASTSTPTISAPAPSLSSPIPSAAPAPAPSWTPPPAQATAVYAAATPTPAFEQPLNNVSAGFGGKKAPPAAPEPLL